MNNHQRFTYNILGALSLHIVDQVNRNTESETGLGASGPAAIIQIGLYSDQTVDSLRKSLGLSQSATTRAVEKVKSLGLVIGRKSDERDSRRMILSLTQEGKSMLDRILAAREAALKELVNCLDDSELNQLNSLACKILRSADINTQSSSDFACRLCDVKSCPDEICPLNYGTRCSSKTTKFDREGATSVSPSPSP